MGIFRDSDRDKAIRGLMEDMPGNGVEVDKDERSIVENLTERQADAIARWLGQAWAAGFKAGERQPALPKPTEASR